VLPFISSSYLAFVVKRELHKPYDEWDEVAAFVRQLQGRLHSALSAVCDVDTSSTSSPKELLKLALVGARMTKRLADKSDSFVGVWEPTMWAELQSRLFAHSCFKASAVLGAMCKQVIRLAQMLQTPSIGSREYAEEDHRDEVTVGRKRKADADSGAQGREGRTKRMVPVTKGSKTKKHM
jgi:hypothetical protein